MRIGVVIERARENERRPIVSKVTLMAKTNGCVIKEGLPLAELSTTLHI